MTDPDPQEFLAVLSTGEANPRYHPMDKYRDFRNVFLGSDQGLRVLHEILRMCGVNKDFPGPGPVDPYQSHVSLGKRSIGLGVIVTLAREPQTKPKEANHE